MRDTRVTRKSAATSSVSNCSALPIRECSCPSAAPSRETVRRSELAGWAHYGRCAAHSRWYWGLKLYLITTPDGMPVAWCLADPKLGRQWIESVYDTLKGQLDLERHGGRTTQGLYARITQRLLAMAACIWHNWATGQPVKRSLTAFDN